MGETETNVAQTVQSVGGILIAGKARWRTSEGMKVSYFGTIAIDHAQLQINRAIELISLENRTLRWKRNRKKFLKEIALLLADANDDIDRAKDTLTTTGSEG